MGLLPGSLPPYDLVYSYFEDFICTGTNSGERRAHDDIWRDTDALRRFLIGIENPNAADHGSNVARQRKRRHIAIRALCWLPTTIAPGADRNAIAVNSVWLIELSFTKMTILPE